MSWWQTLISAAVPSIVAAGALIWQNRQNNARDGARRKDDADEREKDRAHEAAKAERQRLETLSDHWRDDRTTAHVDLLAAFDAAITDLDRINRYPARPWSDQLDADLMRLMHAQVARVQVVGSAAPREAAERVHLRIRHADLSFRMASLEEPDLDDDERKTQVDKLKELVQRAKYSRDDYLKAVRRELGTHGSA